jgi:hypothetical protein
MSGTFARRSINARDTALLGIWEFTKGFLFKGWGFLFAVPRNLRDAKQFVNPESSKEDEIGDYKKSRRNRGQPPITTFLAFVLFGGCPRLGVRLGVSHVQVFLPTVPIRLERGFLAHVNPLFRITEEGPAGSNRSDGFRDLCRARWQEA